MTEKRPAPTDALIEAALALAAEGRWREIGLDEIAERAGVSQLAAYRLTPDKGSVLAAFMRSVDADLIAQADPEWVTAPVKDRLFDIIMSRPDLLEPHRAALTPLMSGVGLGVGSGLALARQLPQSVSRMLNASGLSGRRTVHMLRVKTLSVVYLATLRSWLKDESEDRSATMATLDRLLDRAMPVLLMGAEREEERNPSR